MKRVLACFVGAFVSQVHSFHSNNVPLAWKRPTPSGLSSRQPTQTASFLTLRSKNNGEEEEKETIFVEPGSEEFSAEQWSEMEEAQPSELAIMKDLLGINIFTYILAFLILVFTGLNLTLGPGWLGGTLGIAGTGSIEEISPSLPNTVDLNKDEFLL